MTATLRPGTAYSALLAALSFPGVRRLPGATGQEASSGSLAAQLVAMGTSASCQWNLAEGSLHGTGLPPLLLALQKDLEESREKQWAMAHLLRWEEGVRKGCDLLSEAGFPHPIVLKGGATKYTLYPSPHLRSSSDVDLLLPPEFVLDAAEVLMQHGFSLVESDGRRPFTARYGHHVMLRRAETVFELHRSVDNLVRPSLSYERLMEDSVALTDLHAWLRGPSPMATLLVAAAHALKHGLLLPLRDLVDVQLALESAGIDGALLLTQARRAQLAQVLAFLALQAGSLSGRWTTRHSLLALELPATATFFEAWRFGGSALAEGSFRKLVVHALLTPGTRSTRRLLTRFANRRGRDLLSRVRAGGHASR